MATPNIVPRADSEGGLGTASKYWASAYIDTITTTGNVDINGNLTVEDTIELTDGGSTVRGKLILNASDRDNVELRAESLGSTMKFFTVGTEALLLDGSQNATFAGAVNVSGEALTVTNGNSEKPLLHLKATNNSAAGPHIKFEVDRGAAPAVGDDLGTILWAGEDSNQNTHHYAKILGEILNPASTDEAGRLTLFVGESDGTTADLSPGLKLEGSSSVDGEVNVTLGNAVTSKTSIPGRLGVGANSTDVEAALTIKGDPGNTNQPAKITNSSQDTHTGLFLNSTGNAVNEKYGMQFGGFNEYSVGGIFGLIDSTSGSTSGDITIDMCDGTTANALIERVRFTHEGNVGVGITPVSRLHIYEDSAETGENAGITVEQDGTGDATIQFLLTGTRRWATGIDNSNSDAFTIASSGDLGSDGVLTLSTGGNATFSGDVNIADNSKLKFGDSADLEIFHDGSHSRIKDAGVGHLTINATDFVVNNSGDTKNMIIATDGGATSLYCDGSLKLATTSTGVTVTGTLNGIPFFTDVTNNSMYTHDPSGNTNYATAQNNTSYGFSALAATTTGDNNTAIGKSAGGSLNSGNNNTILGAFAGDALTTADYNVAVGMHALGAEDTFGYSVAVGAFSLLNQNGADNAFNVGVGYGTGQNITTGVRNVIIGGSAGDGISLGSHNIALGYDALTAVNAGSRSVAIGSGALQVQVPEFTDATCDYNNDPTIAHDTNTAILVGMRVTGTGIPANSFVKTKTSNTEFELGNAAGDDVSTTGGSVTNGTLTFTGGVDSNNTAVGYNAGKAVTTGLENTIIGSLAGDALTTGSYNVAIGKGALSSEDTGGTNVAIGYATLTAQDSGANAYNVAIGFDTGKAVSTGVQNTLIGGTAGDALTTGSANVVIGYNAAGAAVSAGNEIIIGSNASGNGSNKITIGDSNINAFHCQVQSLSALSDERDKKDIQDSTYGLEYLESLRPVTFEWDQRDGNRKGLKDLGFIAQEMQGKDDEYTRLVESNDPEKLQASYGRLIPILVKAIQELSEEVKALKNK